MSAWANLLRLPAQMMELGLTVMDAGAKTMRQRLDAMAGPPQQRVAPHAPPVHGPQDLDTALADFANQLMRIGWVSAPEGIPLRQLASDVLNSARRAFGYMDLSNPRTLALPFELPLSAGGLAADTMLRLMALTSVVGPKRLKTFITNAAEVYVDTAVFIGLEYKEVIERYKDRLKEHPDDHSTRLELGRMYVKCGLYDEAVRELNLAASDPALRGRAKHESALAHFRGGRYQLAVDDGVAAMTADPSNERARAAMWLASRPLGGYPDTVPEPFRMELKAGYAPTRLEFENIAAKIGLDKISAGRGTAVFDYNNDGLLDIVVTAAHAGCSLYRNNGDGTFTDVSVQSGMDKCINGFVVIAGDYDNDGYQDLFVTRQGFYYGDCGLYHNNGDGTFTNVTEKAGVASWGPAYTATWVDYDCDGRLDLFIAYNLGGMFDRALQNRLFHNNGDGTFTDVSREAGITDPLVGTTCFFADYNNDGWLDIVQFSWSDHEEVIYTMKNGRGPDDGSPLVVYENNGDGTFTAKTREIGLDGCWGTMSGNWGDVNNDGYIDLLLGNGSPRMERLEPFILLENDRGQFRNTTFAAGLPYFGKSHGTNCADLFGDGRMSIIIAAGGGYPGDLLMTAVHCPKTLPGAFLNVRVTGVKSNRDGNGARITLRAGGLTQVREVNNGAGFGCLPLEQHFGLGTAEKVDSLEIRWPSGLVQKVADPPINDTIRVTEGEPGWIQVYKR